MGLGGAGACAQQGATLVACGGVAVLLEDADSDLHVPGLVLGYRAAGFRLHWVRRENDLRDDQVLLSFPGPWHASDGIHCLIAPPLVLRHLGDRPAFHYALGCADEMFIALPSLPEQHSFSPSRF